MYYMKYAKQSEVSLEEEEMRTEKAEETGNYFEKLERQLEESRESGQLGRNYEQYMEFLES